MKFKHYTYSDPSFLPVDFDGYLPGYDAYCKAAGFDPEDDEVNVGMLTEEWNGHPAGSVVVSGLTTEGHPFAVEVK